MDEIDSRILRELQFNARVSNADLASRVGLSASPCWNRVRALEQQGVIEKYIAVFDQAALGLPDTVIIEVTLDRHDDDILKKFEAALERMPEVVEAYLMTGEYDFFIKVAVAGTEGYERFLREKLYKNSRHPPFAHELHAAPAETDLFRAAAVRPARAVVLVVDRAAIDREDLPSNEGGIVARQERHRAD